MTTLDVYLESQHASVSLHGAWRGVAAELWTAIYQRCKQGTLGDDWSAAHANLVLAGRELRDLAEGVVSRVDPEHSDVQSLRDFLSQLADLDPVGVTVIEF